MKKQIALSFFILWVFLQGYSQTIQNGKALPFTEGEKLVGSRDWTKVYVDITVSSGTDSLLLFCSLVGDGTAWFDDVRLEKFAAPSGQPVSAKPYRDTSLALINRTAPYKNPVDSKAPVADARVMYADTKTTSKK